MEEKDDSDESTDPYKMSDHERALELMSRDNIPLDKALKIAKRARTVEEEQMGPPQELPREAYAEEYYRLQKEINEKR